MRKTQSAILEAVHETALGLHQAGVMSKITLCELAHDYFAERAKRGNLTAALTMLNRSGGQAPDVEDRV